jgi:CxxC motif-containing protein
MRKLTCIVCPSGCSINVNKDVDPWNIVGNLCPRGIDFARKELTNPTRTVCSTARTSFATVRRLPVRTRGEVPLASVRSVMSEISRLVVDREARTGDTLIENVAGTGVAVVATADLADLMEWEDCDGRPICSGD